MIVTSPFWKEGLAIYSPKMWNTEDQCPHPQWEIGGSM